MVISSISSNEKITLATAPLIFCSTILSHCVSASVGREGAALQLGGALGDLFGSVLRLDEKDKKIAVMCGMSACFAAVFGTPLAAGVFAMEVVSIGVMYYSALVPCLFASFIGAGIAGKLGLAPESFPVSEIPAMSISGTAMGMACLFVSVTNCPVSTILMAFELFGFEAMPYFAIAVAVSFTLSGYYGLYSSQKFIYSKIRNEYINRKSH